jgi:hypothetical protein
MSQVWRKTYEELKKKPFAESARMARVDCTAQQAQQLCQRQHIHAFPTIRIYRHKLIHSHENYLGDRDSKAFLEFMEESLPHKREGAGEGGDLSQKSISGQAVEAHTLDGEGCQLTGSVRISRVPGHLRIRAASDEHSFNTRVMNVSHHVDKLLFSSLIETPRLRHVLPLEQRSGLLSSSCTRERARAPRTRQPHAPATRASHTRGSHGRACRTRDGWRKSHAGRRPMTVDDRG